MPRQGFVSGLFGRLTRSLGRGGSGRWVTDWTAAFCGFGTMLELRFGELLTHYRCGTGSTGRGWTRDVGFGVEAGLFPTPKRLSAGAMPASSPAVCCLLLLRAFVACQRNP